MTRRRTLTRTCTHSGCTERSFVEYTARRDLEDVSPTWKCYRHSKPNEVLSAYNPETRTVLELHPKYTSGSRYVSGVGYTDEPQLLGCFWGPAGDPEHAHHGVQSGPGFRAIAEDFPPGTRLIVTARVELPEEPQSGAQRAAELKADWARYRVRVLAEVWEALRDAEDGPLIDGMGVVNKLLEDSQ